MFTPSLCPCFVSDYVLTLVSPSLAPSADALVSNQSAVTVGGINNELVFIAGAQSWIVVVDVTTGTPRCRLDTCAAAVVADDDDDDDGDTAAVILLLGVVMRRRSIYWYCCVVSQLRGHY